MTSSCNWSMFLLQRMELEPSLLFKANCMSAVLFQQLCVQNSWSSWFKPLLLASQGYTSRLFNQAVKLAWTLSHRYRNFTSFIHFEHSTTLSIHCKIISQHFRTNMGGVSVKTWKCTKKLSRLLQEVYRFEILYSRQ